MKLLLPMCALLWFSTAVAGVFYLAQYESTPADAEISYPLTFPSESGVERSIEHSTLLFFAHPKCPCTRASLRELSRLTADVNGKLRAFVIFTKPADAAADWAQTDLRANAENIPNVSVLIDDAERETRIFNAQTSGLTLLYDRDGALRFEGGITAGRGHEGDNAGKTAVFEIITKNLEQKAESAVFGCSLRKKDCPDDLTEKAP